MGPAYRGVSPLRKAGCHRSGRLGRSRSGSDPGELEKLMPEEVEEWCCPGGWDGPAVKIPLGLSNRISRQPAEEMSSGTTLR